MSAPLKRPIEQCRDIGRETLSSVLAARQSARWSSARRASRCSCTFHGRQGTAKLRTRRTDPPSQCDTAGRSRFWRAQCHAPNSLAASRHQARLVSDRRTRELAVATAAYGPDKPPSSLGVISRRIASDEHFISHHKTRASRPQGPRSITLVGKARPATADYAGTVFLCALLRSYF